MCILYKFARGATKGNGPAGASSSSLEKTFAKPFAKAFAKTFAKAFAKHSLSRSSQRLSPEAIRSMACVRDDARLGKIKLNDTGE